MITPNQSVKDAVIWEILAEMNRTDENATAAPTAEDYLSDITRRCATLLGETEDI